MSSAKHWVAAARLRTLPLSISGIIVGSAMGDSNFLKSPIFWLAILTTIGFQIISNFANDYGDGIKGTDKDRKGEKRMVADGIISGIAMKRAVMVTSALTFTIAIFLIYEAFGNSHFYLSVFFLVLGILAIVAAIKYTVGKNAYGYSGFGDLFVFIFFGWVSVVGSYFLFTKQLQWDVFLPATAMGLLSIAVLNLNNMRDIESDKLHKKNTLVVKMGIQNAKIYHSFIILISLFCMVVYTLLHHKTSFLFLIAYIPLLFNLATVWNNKKPQLLDSELKKVALSTFLLSVLFALSTVYFL